MHEPPSIKRSLEQRPNAVWLEELRGHGPGSEGAVQELEAYLRRILTRMLHGRLPVDDIAELVQESLASIVKSLASFRGDSAFTTWATSVATRTAFTALRRRRVREARHEPFDAVQAEARLVGSSDALPPDEALSRSQLVQALEHAIATRLTERQRVAVLAELRGIPTVEIAKQLQTNQNALYKLTHDSRKKLRQALLEAGFSAESLHDHATGAHR